MKQTGEKIYDFVNEIFPIDRWLMGKGVRKTLDIIKRELPNLKIYNVLSGTKVFDWEIPMEWDIRDAYIEDKNRRRIVDYKENNLVVVGYSEAVNKYVTKQELLNVIYVEEDEADAIPYCTSYYDNQYGFCMSQKTKSTIEDGIYHIVIDSRKTAGVLSYGELIISGKSKKEILLSTYICHPSMANDNCSGIGLLVYLAKWLQKKELRYTYRIIFIPETIGAITYLSKNYLDMKKNTIAGFNFTCVGDNKAWSYVATPEENTYSDKIIRNIMKFNIKDYKKYSYLQRGSDERQFNAPGIDLPVVTVCRSKFYEFPEYHTSLDNMDFVSVEGFQGSFDLITKCLELVEKNNIVKMKVLCEPQLGKRGLFPNISKKNIYNDFNTLLNFISYINGKRDLFDISEKIGVGAYNLISIMELLLKEELIEIIKQ